MDSSPLLTIHGDVEAARGVIATAIHAGHSLRPEIGAQMTLDDAIRLREEDPLTDRIAGAVPVHVVVHRSRFEVDLNRERSASVYRRPDDAWGLEVCAGTLPEDVVERSRAEHDAFYATMRKLLDAVAARGPFVVLDVHSYNHRRAGPDEPPAPREENPEVNIGTGTVDRTRFGALVDGLAAGLGDAWVAGHRLDVRENVRFRGGFFSRWVNERYSGRACALAIEFKKTFMDEWTGVADADHLAQLGERLRDTSALLRGSLAERS
jgi:N-formylglutamate amidohydrolase